jgi:two-component system, LytTR family, sensor kinase
VNKKLIHIVFLLIIFFFSAIPIVLKPGSLTYSQTRILIILITIGCVGSFYVFYSYLVPSFFFKNKALKFWMLSIIFIVAYPIVWFVIFRLINYVFGQSYYSSFPDSLLYPFLNTVLVGLFGGLSRFIRNWYETIQIKQELENKTIKSELALLRSQINPHFLFNTLNNIHTYAYVDAEKTAYSIEKLSDIMRYMLYESNTEKVFLEREIEYIKSYIDLLNLKFKEKDFVQFNIEGEVAGKRISPMLFIPFVENAFKHGKKKISHPGIIVNLKVNSELIEFDVTNHVSENIVENDEDGGIGLQNITRRLELLYPERHEFTIEENDNKFFVKLIIKE